MKNVTYRIVELIQDRNLAGACDLLKEMCPQELCNIAEDIQAVMLDSSDATYDLYKQLIEKAAECAGRRCGNINRILREIGDREVELNGEPEFFPEEQE